MAKIQPTQSADEFFENESQELSLGENTSWVGNIKKALPAFNSRNYQLYFAGQLVSMVGTWLQIVAEGWLIFQLTHSALYVGLDAAASTVPSLFLSLIGGVIADRYPKKIILICTQAASMLLAFTLAILTLLHMVTVWEIILLAFGLGLVNAIDNPTRQAYITELIDAKSSLASAIALNSGMFNAARVIGPSIAGVLIATVGTGMAFLLNGVSYIAVIIALLYIRTSMVIQPIHARPIDAIKEGLQYTYHHSLIRTLIILSGVVSIFGWSYSTLMPVIATQTFHLNAAGLGYLYTAAGLGALTGTIIISAFSKVINPITFILSGTIYFAVALFLFTYVSYVPIALLLLFIIGMGLVSQFAMINTVIQHEVDDHMRGRVLALYTLVFMGFSPLGNLEIGFIGENFGPALASRINAGIVFLVGLYLFYNRQHFIKSEEPLH